MVEPDYGCLVVIREDDRIGVQDEDKERIFDREFRKNTGSEFFLVREILSLTGIIIKGSGLRVKGPGSKSSSQTGRTGFRMPAE